MQRAEILRRINLARRLADDPQAQRVAKAHLRNNVVDFFNDWVWGYDPRVAGQHGLSPWMPFHLFPKQTECLYWLDRMVSGRQEWLLDKSRDVGATYLCCGFALHHWLFEPGFKTSFGSYEADKVDHMEDPDSIFQKLRIIRMRLPIWMHPEGFDPRFHDLYMRLLNPENGCTITGEAGDEMGRGGRSSLYILDEAAFVARAERVQAALVGTADCIGWVSSVKGMGNLFARKRFALPPEQIFTLHFRDDPRKDKAWEEAKRRTVDDVTFASEFDIDYTASVEGVCIPARWVEAAKELAALEPKLPKTCKRIAGGDVGGGKSKSVLIVRAGPLVPAIERRQEADTTNTAFWMLDICVALKTDLLNWDAPGVGLGVTSTMKHADGYEKVRRQAVNTGAPASRRVWPDDRTSEQMFGNLKAELWWLARQAFWRTFQHVMAIKGAKNPEGEAYAKQPLDELIALPNDPSLSLQLSLPRVFKNDKGKMVIETKEQLRKRGIPSPDEADAFVLTFLDEHDDGTSRMDLNLVGQHRDNPWQVR